MKVLHVLSSNIFSGAENVVCQIISMFKNDANVQMIYSSPDGSIRDALRDRDIPFIPIKKLSVSEIKRLIDEEKPDIIHAHDKGASLYCALACGKKPLISHIHGNDINVRKINAKSCALLFSAIKSKNIIWVSDSAFNGFYFKKILKNKSKILYNIIDVKQLYKKAEEDEKEYNYDIIYLGRLTYPKNPQRLMRVLSKVCEKKSDLRACVVGSGDLEEETKKLCEDLGISRNVDFLGFKENPYKILKNSKAMIMTSIFEGTPMCALEALALGVPMVCTPVDGLKKIIKNDENGFVSDNDDELAQVLFDIITKENYRDKLSNGAYNFSKNFNNINSYKQKLTNCYFEQ